MCGKDMGGVWVPGANGSKTYIPLKCNGTHSLYIKPSNHSYFDIHSGMLIFPTARPKLDVDPKGCIRSNHGKG